MYLFMHHCLFMQLPMVCMFTVCLLHALNQPQYRAHAATLSPTTLALSVLLLAAGLMASKLASGLGLLCVSDASTTAARNKRLAVKQTAVDTAAATKKNS